MSALSSFETVEREIAGLQGLAFAALQERFQSLYDGPAPKRIGRKLLILAIAYEMQRKAESVRVDRLMARVRAAKTSSANRLAKGGAQKRSLKAGGRLLREWRGKSYEVYVADDGCYLDGKRYGSLSAAAEAITGVKRNGPAFFGLRSPRSDA